MVSVARANTTLLAIEWVGGWMCEVEGPTGVAVAGEL